VMWLSYQRK